jgi:hypothetical protein
VADSTAHGVRKKANSAGVVRSSRADSARSGHRVLRCADSANCSYPYCQSAYVSFGCLACDNCACIAIVFIM